MGWNPTTASRGCCQPVCHHQLCRRSASCFSLFIQTVSDRWVLIELHTLNRRQTSSLKCLTTSLIKVRLTGPDQYHYITEPSFYCRLAAQWALPAFQTMENLSGRNSVINYFCFSFLRWKYLPSHLVHMVLHCSILQFLITKSAFGDTSLSFSGKYWCMNFLKLLLFSSRSDWSFSLLSQKMMSQMPEDRASLPCARFFW